MRERVLWMLDEAKLERSNRVAAVWHVAGLLGMSLEMLWVWYRRCRLVSWLVC